VVALQPSLFDPVGPGGPDGTVPFGRRDLGSGAWVEHFPGWLAASGLLESLVEEVPWRAERRVMYDRVVEVPRLLAFYSEGEVLPDRRLETARDALDDLYREELGEPLATAGLCLYRDGRDSVSWHGDTIGRGAREDTVVAIVSLGATRRLLLRPVGGGPSLRYELSDGDLIVMGGSCQRTWQHAVPKTASAVGLRVSVQFRPRGVR
jgi:alkylated DNA repair dioxygenase AlkB